MKKQIKDFILMMADNGLILGQRLGEWCGHGPVLEQDIAMTNIALDLIGESRSYYQYLAEIEGLSEDDYAMNRDVRSFNNVLLVEQPNGHWGDTIMRQCMFDCYHYFLLTEMVHSNDGRLSAIAKKSIKESTYHLTFSSEWVIRLGDGTEKSHQKMQQSLHQHIDFFEEMLIPTDYELTCETLGIVTNLESIRLNAKNKFIEIIDESTLDFPTEYVSKKGGKLGLHSEHLGFILSDLQYMQKSYPKAQW
jgi:ring-1,2-phenylacetyl-CoA epoxidase subunit PaaC